MSPVDDNQAQSASAAFGHRVRHYAELRGWKQADLCRATGISRQTIHSYWSGKKIATGSYLFSLATALEVEPKLLALGQGTSARELVDQADNLIVNHCDQEALTFKPDLQRIAIDPDLPDDLKLRADLVLQAMGDPEAGRRRLTAMKSLDRAMDRVKSVVIAAVEQFQHESGNHLSAEATDKLINLCRYLLMERLDGFPADMLNYLIREILAIITVPAQSTLHDNSRDFRR